MPRWDTELEAPPPPHAPASEVCTVITAIPDAQLYMALSEGGQKAYLREICEQYEWPWNKVATLLRREAVAARSGTPATLTEFTELGIPIYPEFFGGPPSICPFKVPYFHLGHWSVMTAERCCGSAQHRDCAPSKADAILRKLRHRIEDLDEVHIAEAPYDDALFNRVGQRRHARNLSMFSYHCLDGTVSFVANGPIGGTAAPASTTPCPPTKAFDWIISRLWVPGCQGYSFTGGWTYPASQPLGLHVSLEGLDDAQAVQFRRLADDHIASTYGIKPGIDALPPKLWGTVRAELTKIRGSVRKS